MRTGGARLLASWSEPHRRYHSIGHLRDILEHVEELAGYADDADAVRLAAWFHDSVYAGRPDDEELSARRAEHDLSRLGVAPQLVDEVARLVRLTVSHHPAPGDHNGEVLSDADLAALAVPRERYVQNTAAIRAEYAHIPDDAFRKGRQQVLVSLLEGPGCFAPTTPAGNGRPRPGTTCAPSSRRWPTDVQLSPRIRRFCCANSSSVIRPRSFNAANRSSRSTGSAACAWAAAGFN